jgi:Leucine-rich repeat (LRR) protein
MQQVYKLHLDGVTISGADIAECISEMKSLQYLTASGCGISRAPAGAFAIAEALRVNRGLTTLNLSNNNLSADALAEVITVNSLTELDVSKNGSLDGKVLAEGLMVNDSLSVLNIAHNKLLFTGSKCFAAAVFNHKALRKITFSGDDNSYHVTMEASMTEANFLCKKLGRSGAVIIGAFLPKSRALDTLLLSHNQLGAQGVKYIADYLALPNGPLRKLDLSNNMLRDSGAKYLAKHIGENRWLTELDVSRNVLTLEAKQAIQEAAVYEVNGHQLQLQF